MDRIPRWAPLAAIAAGVAARFALFPFKPNLWEDEIIATTHAVQPIGRLIVDVARNDIHPPLYFIQLHIWGLVSHADAWFVANSVAWSLAALCSLWLVVRRLTGDELVALTAAAIMAVLPSAVEMAFSVRMYAMLSTLVIWAYYFAHRSFAEDRRSALWPLVVINLLIVYIHAVGFLAVAFNGLYALIQLFERSSSRSKYYTWLAVYGGTGLLALPMLASDAIHDAYLEPVGGIATVLNWFATAVVGMNPAGGAAWVVLGLAVFLILAVFGLKNRKTRSLVISFILCPLVLAVIASLVLKPIFKANFFSGVMAPFVAMVFAHLIIEVPNAMRRVAAFAASAITLALMSASALAVDTKSTDFGAAAAVIRAHARSGDVVYVPQLSMFWGMAWNLAGPDWGSTLRIAPPPSDQWRKIYARLGPKLVARLGLMPETQSLPAGNLSLVVGKATLANAEQAPRLWIVAYPRVDAPAGTFDKSQGSLRRTAVWTFGYNGKLSVALYERTSRVQN